MLPPTCRGTVSHFSPTCGVAVILLILSILFSHFFPACEVAVILLILSILFSHFSPACEVADSNAVFHPNLGWMSGD
jgi:hypothetical protein